MISRCLLSTGEETHISGKSFLCLKLDQDFSFAPAGQVTSLDGLSEADIAELRTLRSGTHGPAGTVTGDPHFTGFNGALYDFQVS